MFGHQSWTPVNDGTPVNCPECNSVMSEMKNITGMNELDGIRPIVGDDSLNNLLSCRNCRISFTRGEMLAYEKGELGVRGEVSERLSSERKSKTKKRTTRKKGKRYYSKLKVGQLKKILKEKGLSVGGVKGELVERLTDNSWKKKQQTPWNERKDVRKSKKKRHAISLESKSHEFLWSQYHIILLASTFLITWILFGDAILAIMCTIAILILQMLDHAWNEQGRYGER